MQAAPLSCAMDIFANLVDAYGHETAALVAEEFRTGANFELIKAQKAHQKLSEVPHQRSQGVDGLGFIAADIPAEIYWNWDTFKKGFWQSKEDREWFLKKNPQYRRRYQPKPQVGWVPIAC